MEGNLKTGRGTTAPIPGAVGPLARLPGIPLPGRSRKRCRKRCRKRDTSAIARRTTYGIGCDWPCSEKQEKGGT